MAAFIATSEALRQWRSNVSFQPGQHTAYRSAVGNTNVHMLGDLEFDPDVHDFDDINHDSLEGVATRDYFVTEQLPEEGLRVNMVLDATTRNEHPVVSRGKEKLAKNLGIAVSSALKGESDQVMHYRLISGAAARRRSRQGNIAASDPEEYTRQIQQLAYKGLTFVITDGRRFHPAADSLGRRNVVAIKYNHRLEREVPADVGIIALTDEEGEIDTSNPRKLAKANTARENEHQAIVKRLRDSGVAVAEVITARTVQGYDMAAADKQIAAAIKQLAQKA